ncbi:hypothetical protein QP027_08335 [Corynebacterium breve]|uniref:Uncharacterized protein n=1 Tax=Corynebacterium breve TaxID=3049799 RepID=A0ABY8VFY2_9CORY|nr:hypothetical protein [Corynebacterium breve]WIM67129.1 hypothetical protein QP027_08335 [Corynebacterium breve]
MTTPAHWIASEIEAGRTGLQSMLDRSPFPRVALRTIAEDGDFHIIDHRYVARNPDFKGESWFPEKSALIDRGDGTWGLVIDVTDELRAGGSLPVPRALINVLGVPRADRVVLDSDTGAKIVSFVNDEPKVSSISSLLHDDTRVTLVFDPETKRLTVEA